MKVGLLLPKSTVYPLLHHDFLSGLKTCLNHYELSQATDLVSDNIGFGTSKELLQEKAENLLLVEQVQVLVVFADHPNVDALFPLIKSLNKLLIIVNNGAKYAGTWTPEPSVIYLTLNELFASWSTSLLAVEEGVKSAILATSFYDGGYGHCHALTQPIMNNNGGIVFNFVTKHLAKDFDLSPLQQFLIENPAERAVVATYSGDLTSKIYNGLNQFTDLKAYVSPMMLDETAPYQFENMNVPFEAKGYTTWVSTLDNKENQVFIEKYKNANGRAANLFATLGWDLGLLLKEIAATEDTHQFIGRKLVDGLVGKQLSSVRGSQQFNTITHHFLSPLYLVSAENDFQLTLENTITDVESSFNDFITETEQLAPLGWFNTYLCS